MFNAIGDGVAGLNEASADDLPGMSKTRDFTPDLDRSKPKRDRVDPSNLGLGGARLSPDRADALVWAFTELLVEEISSWGIYETTRRKAEAQETKSAAARAAAIPKPEPAPGSLEYQALHPEWKPQEE